MHQLTTLGKMFVGMVLGSLLLLAQCLMPDSGLIIGLVLVSNLIFGLVFILAVSILYCVLTDKEDRYDDYIREPIEKLSLVDFVLLSGMPTLWAAYKICTWVRHNALRDGVFIERIGE